MLYAMAAAPDADEGRLPYLADPLLLAVFAHLDSTDLRRGVSLACTRFRELLRGGDIGDGAGGGGAWRHVVLDFK